MQEQYGIDPAIVFAIIERESEFNAAAIGDGGKSYGLMQVQPRWHEERMDKHGVTDLTNPYQNVSVGIDYLAELTNKYDGNIEKALIAYNTGATGAHRDYFSKGIYSNEYSKDIISNSEKLNFCVKAVKVWRYE